jgi:hypothetical protein
MSSARSDDDSSDNNNSAGGGGGGGGAGAGRGKRAGGFGGLEAIREAGSVASDGSSATGNNNELLKPEDLFKLLFGDLSVEYIKAVSHNERKTNAYTSSTLSYGDIEFKEIQKIFNILELNGFVCERHSHFVDIGCGCGKPVFAVSLLYKFESLKGIEILNSLVELCHERMSKWIKICTQKHLRRMLQQDIDFVCGDALKVNWSHATVVFIHGTAFDNVMMHTITDKLNRLAPHSYVISISKKVDSQFLEFLESVDVTLSWGNSEAHLYRRSEELYVPEGATTTDTEFLLSFGITEMQKKKT